MITEPELPSRDLLATKRTALASERTLLAAERTFLAWLRTGMAGIGGGILITRLAFEYYSHWLAAQIVGNFLILWGMSLFVFAFLGYNRIRMMLQTHLGYKTSILGYAAIIATLIILSIILLVITFLRL